MKHAWGFAGFKDRHDELRREAEDAIEDGSRSSDCHRVANVELEKERQRVHQVRMYVYMQYIHAVIDHSIKCNQVLARRTNRRKKRKQKLCCSYKECKQPSEPLCPCESVGLCPNVAHASCCKRGNTGKIVCSVCANKSNSPMKRGHDATPTEVGSTTRSVSKSSRISTNDPTRVR